MCCFTRETEDCALVRRPPRWVIVKEDWAALLSLSLLQPCGQPQSNAQPVQTYSSLEHARRVVLELGIEQMQVDATLNLFPKLLRTAPFLATRCAAKCPLDHGFKLQSLALKSRRAGNKTDLGGKMMR
jgi:hypothetical protein